MEHHFAIAALWLGLAVLSAVIAYHARISIALVEITVGVAAAAAAARFGGPEELGSNLEWLRFLAASGAILLTFLAGAELEAAVLRAKAAEVTIVGVLGLVGGGNFLTYAWPHVARDLQPALVTWLTVLVEIGIGLGGAMVLTSILFCMIREEEEIAPAA